MLSVRNSFILACLLDKAKSNGAKKGANLTIFRKLVVASNNLHKIAEIRAVLGGAWDVISAQDLHKGIKWDETGATFIDNARIKVKALRAYTDQLILADDSGLCVDALSGRPGVHSSSYAGVEGDHHANNIKLLRDLSGVPKGSRTAQFLCLLLLDQNGIESVFEGRCEGEIAEEVAGSGGFGYDPLFVEHSTGKLMAKMSLAEKNIVSHRGKALLKLKAKLNV